METMCSCNPIIETLAGVGAANLALDSKQEHLRETFTAHIRGREVCGHKIQLPDNSTGPCSVAEFTSGSA